MSVEATATPNAQNFISSIAVNIHLLADQSNAYTNVNTVITSLNYLGITLVRDAIYPMQSGYLSDPEVASAQAAYQQVADAGIKFDLCVGSSNSNLAVIMSSLDAFEKLHPGDVSFVEGPNEINNFPFSYNGQVGQAAADAFQGDLFRAVHADALLQGVAVIDYTGGTARNTSGLADEANVHNYPQCGTSPAANIDDAYNQAYDGPISVPKVETEAGFNSDPTYEGGVDENVQAKSTLNLLFDASADGVSTTYLYELLDHYLDPAYSNVDSHWGIFNADGSPKLAAKSIYDLKTILAASPVSKVADEAVLSYKISGLPSLGHSLLLQNTGQTSDLAVWAEPQIWDPNSRQEIVAPDNIVNIDFGHVVHQLSVFDPLISALPLETFSDVSHVSVDVTDHPLILQVVDSADIAEAAVACYCSGTLIATGSGSVAVEDLEVGDCVLVGSGTVEPIQWIGRRSYVGRKLASFPEAIPVLISAGALGDNLPLRPLRVSQKHAMMLDGFLIPAKLLVNGTTIVLDVDCTRVDYFHLELAEHNVVFAEGALSETFVDEEGRGSFLSKQTEILSRPGLYGIPQYCANRVESGAELEAVRRRLGSAVRPSASETLRLGLAA